MTTENQTARMGDDAVARPLTDAEAIAHAFNEVLPNGRNAAEFRQLVLQRARDLRRERYGPRCCGNPENCPNEYTADCMPRARELSEHGGDGGGKGYCDYHGVFVEGCYHCERAKEKRATQQPASGEVVEPEIFDRLELAATRIDRLHANDSHGFSGWEARDIREAAAALHSALATSGRLREALIAAVEWAGPMGEAPVKARPAWFDKARHALATNLAPNENLVGTVRVQEASLKPHVHPEYGPGFFFTEDALIDGTTPATAAHGGSGEGALAGMFPGLQSDLAKVTTGARLMGSFENPDWNQVREALEGRVVAAASALMAHAEAAGMTLEKDGISVQIAPIAYEGDLS